MPRLIDGDALELFIARVRKALYLDHTLSDIPTRDSMLLNFQQYVHLQPTIDAVPVVRCKDCVNVKCIDEMEGVYTCTHPQWIRKTHKDTYEDGRLFHGLEANDFCSYGERKEDRK